jgi:hypothetical protein
MKAYKVVGKKDRISTNGLIIQHICCGHALHLLQSPFIKYYKKGSIVEAEPDSAGICCFQTLEDAEKFILDELSKYDDTLILVVEGIEDPIPYNTITLYCCGEVIA